MTDRIKALEDALRPFSRVAGEMFARNWNRDDVAILFDGECEEIRLTFADFLSALAASQPAPDCHQPDLVTADSSQPAQPVAVKVKPLVFDWQPAGDPTNPSKWRCDGDWGFAYVLIPYEPSNDPAAGTGTWKGTWNANPNHNGRMWFASRKDAMAYCEKTIRDHAERRVMEAMADLRKWADVAAHRPLTVQDAARVPEIAALIEAAKKIHDSYWYSSDGIITGMYDLGEALRAIAEVK